ncbi:unnamed protein product [Cunninghamella blakesleeana]
MKFGAYLQSEIFAPWRLSYIQYDVLKIELRTRQEDHTWNENDERDFIALLQNELEKVFDFVNAKLTEVEARINYCERSIRTFTNNPTFASDQNWDIMDEALTEVLFDVNDLAKFTRLNYIGFQKILKKHDKWTGLNLQKDFVPQLRAKPLDKQRFEVAIVYISSLHDMCRRKGQPQLGNSAAGGDQNAFERATAKYWIHPDNITEVKAIIMLHLPVLIFNHDKPFEASDAAISSIYYDNTDFALYTGRLQRDEGAEAIRFRWYGPYDTRNVFIERKTHHAAWLNGASVKDRFRVDEPDVAKFVSEKQLDPVLRVFYNRTAFQIPGDQRVRVSLDTDLTFIREDNFDKVRRKEGEWRRSDVGIDTPFRYLDEEEILRFPYAVLETKLQTHLGQEPPEWLTNLIESHLVHEVPRFSKYLHGAAHFYRDNMPLLPWWLSELEMDIRKPRSTNFGLSRSKSFKPLIDGHYSNTMKQENNRMNMVAHRANSVLSQRKNSTHGYILQDTSTNTTEDFEKSAITSDHPSIQINEPVQQQSDDFDEKVYPMSSSQYQEMAAIDKSEATQRKIQSSDEKKKKGRDSDMTAVPIGTPVQVEHEEKKKEFGVTKVRVEPKVFFANERTFISWLQFCALLLTVALNLLNFGDEMARICGGVFIGIAAVVAIYALYRFEKRAYMINRRIIGRYDDIWGPAVLCVLLIGALIVNFYLRFRPT